MVFFFWRKNRIEEIEKNVKDSFNKIKEDFSKIGNWISFFDVKNKELENQIKGINERINSLEEEILEIKEAFSLFGKKVFKQPQTAVYKQTTPVDVQTPVQTAVQTAILDKLTLSERSIVLALIYSNMKLSYEDLAAMLGKDKSTIRGQINAIKQKSESLIQEYIEPNGKKRVFVPEEIAKMVLKSVKVRVKNKRNKEENEKE